MSKQLTLEEKESRRKEGIRLLNLGHRPASVARELGVSRVSVGRWQEAYKQEGIKGIKSLGALGRRARLSDKQTKKIVRLLLKGARAAGYSSDLWTLKRVVDLVYKHTGERYTPSGLWKILDGLGFSNQRPTTKAIQRDEVQIEQWKKKDWPRIKKTPVEKSKELFLWMRAVYLNVLIWLKPGPPKAKRLSFV